MFSKITALVGSAALALITSYIEPVQAAPGHGARSPGGAHSSPSAGRGFSGSRSFSAPRSYSGPRSSAPRAYSGPRASRSPGYTGRTYTGPRASGRRYTGRHFRGNRYWYNAYAAPFAGYYAYSNYGCDWLLRRARETDSNYWWNRYEACVGDDD